MLMLMMMMKKKATKTLAVVALLLVSAANGILSPTDHDLSQMSQLGEKYLDKQIENAINGVKEMKSIMDKSSDEHKTFLNSLEETKLKKEEALRTAQEMETKLEQEEEVCNETMRALWEECKPCLKNTCVKYYSRTCSSGAGMVGRQLDRVLNRTSPFSIWINGENVETLEKESERQNQRFHSLEDKYSEVEDGVDGIFSDSMKVFDHMRSLDPPLFPFRMPSLWGQKQHRSQPEALAGEIRVARSPLQEPSFHGFQSMFFPMMESARDLFSHMGPMVDGDGDMEAPTSEDGSVNEDVVITKPFGTGQMTCREIRRNSAGCIKLREECQKCKDIKNLDCSGRKPLEGPLKAELEEALAAAERLTQLYSALLRSFEERMYNTSAVLDFLNQQFSWVSSLANSTDTKNPIFQVQAVISKERQEKGGEENEPSQTEVSVHLFDAPPMTLQVPGDIPWSEPKFTEVVAQKALDRYKEGSVVVK
ncbi:clusterin [Gadus morhua]|uniref:Clusterin n=1 Tax=Gadus morhua TaxID=8049 RepID=A0A8C4ZQT0_GADMO|nr:clusterin [Gadus morhua]